MNTAHQTAAGRRRKTASAGSSKRRSGSADGERIARLFRQALDGYSRPQGVRPSTPEEEEDDIFLELLASVFEINRRIRHHKNGADKGVLAALYTARSFSTPEAMGRATGAVRELLQANRRIAVDMERAFDRVKGRIEATEWSASKKTEVWREINQGLAAKFQFRSEFLEKQKIWTEATVETYEFALCHSDQLRFEGKTVRSSNQEVGQEFIENLRRAKQYREAFREAADQLQKEQVSVLAGLGVGEFLET